jgi:hypothetical protein
MYDLQIKFQFHYAWPTVIELCTWMILVSFLEVFFFFFAWVEDIQLKFDVQLCLGYSYHGYWSNSNFVTLIEQFLAESSFCVGEYIEILEILTKYEKQSDLLSRSDLN